VRIRTRRTDELHSEIEFIAIERTLVFVGKPKSASSFFDVYERMNLLHTPGVRIATYANFSHAKVSPSRYDLRRD